MLLAELTSGGPMPLAGDSPRHTLAAVAEEVAFDGGMPIGAIQAVGLFAHLAAGGPRRARDRHLHR